MKSGSIKSNNLNSSIFNISSCNSSGSIDIDSSSYIWNSYNNSNYWGNNDNNSINYSRSSSERS